jgi:hypothetical protein
VQRFGLYGVSAVTTALSALAVLVLVLPNYTTSTIGPTYSQGQLLLVGGASLILWLLFVFVQTVSHRDYFLPEDVTGDGLPDLAVSALGSLEAATGYVSVFEGPLVGDVTLEDAVAQVIGPTRGVEVDSTDFGVGLSAGDTDGDGYADLGIGDPFYGTYEMFDAGLWGGWIGVLPGPFSGNYRAMDAPTQVLSDVGKLGGHLDLRRDLDGDGRADVFTSSGLDRGESYWMGSGYFGNGHAYVFLAPLGGSRLNTSAELQYSNDEVADWGAKAQTTADLTGDGWPDLLIGGPGNYFQLFAVPPPVEPGAWGSAWR